MNTKIVVTASAILLGLFGIGLSFLPTEILMYLNIDTNPVLTLVLQLLGSLYLGFGIMNWMAKGSLIGGIYNRPIAIGNLMHFCVGAITLVKIAIGIHVHTEIIISLAIVYVVFALSFAFIFRTNPGKTGAKK